MASRLQGHDPEVADEDLFLAYKKGDDSAFSTLFERHRGPMTSYAWRMLRRGEEAEEVCVEAFCRVLEGSWRPGGSLRAFLFTVVHRLCIDRIRKRRRVIPFPGTHREEASDDPSPERAVALGQRSARIERALSRLPERHRAVLLLYYHQELPSKEVAEVLQCTDQQVRSRLSYARRLLKDELEREGVTR